MSRWIVLVSVLVSTVVAGACDAGGRSESVLPSEDRPDGIVVASFDFPESRFLAETYAQALENDGYDVVRHLGLGPRELVMPALRQGFVDVVPEYAGSALEAMSSSPGSNDPGSNDPGSTDPGSSGSGSADAVAGLRAAARSVGLDVLAASPASNRNELVVTVETAEREQLSAISDLAPVASNLTIGGPPECPTRRHCLLGLADVYGLRFRSFVPLAGEDLVRRALEEGVIDVGVMFSTDATLADPTDVVVLGDDLALQPADHVVPLVRREVLDDRAVATLDEVSANLTTEGLRVLNWRLANAGTDVAAEARGWLVRQGIVQR